MAGTDDAESYRGPDVPSELGEQLQAAVGLDEPPRTFGDWVDAVVAVSDREGFEVDLDTLCTTDDSPYRATFAGRTQHYQCVQDAFFVPFLLEDLETVEIEARSPERGYTVSFTVTEDAVDVDPATAVCSFGVAAEVNEPRRDEITPALLYERICPYGHAFVSQSEYERWAADVDAVTVALDIEDTLELARALTRGARDGW